MNWSEFREELPLNIMFMLIIILIASVVWVIGNQIYHYDDLVHVESNSIGCNKYRLKGSEWWECPKGSNVSSIEERIGRTAVLRPVIDKSE